MFACRSSDPGSIPGWDRLKYFRSMTCYYTYIKADIVHVSHQINYPTSALPNKACWVIFRNVFVVCRYFRNNTFFCKNIILEITPECQTAWIQIRPNILFGLIWVQTVCKDHQQTAKFAASRQRVKTVHIAHKICKTGSM